METLDGPPLGYEIERSSIMSRDGAPDGYVTAIPGTRTGRSD